MPEYLSKEEVKQWRRSLEKITLEEYAARLGKLIEEDKQTNDLVDIVMHDQPVVTRIEDSSISKVERLNSIANKAFEREKEIKKETVAKREIAKKQEKKAAKQVEVKEQKEEISVKNKVKMTFSKALTEREQMVFDYFSQQQGKIVYAKDLASLLGLPRDYVYKYIKNLRTKIGGDVLQNAENGGYVLTL